MLKAKDSHIFATKITKNVCICNIYAEDFNKKLANKVVNFEQLAI